MKKKTINMTKMALIVLHSVESAGFSETQVLREINFAESTSSKTVYFAFLGTLRLVDLVNFSLQKVSQN